MGILICLVVISFLTLVAERYISEDKNTSFSGILWMYYCSFFLEPSKHRATTTSSRMLKNIWLFGVVIFSATVGGSMKSSEVAFKDKTINTVKDILDRPLMKTLMDHTSDGFMTVVLLGVEHKRMEYKFLLQRNKLSWKTFEFNDIAERMEAISTGKEVLIVDERDIFGPLNMQSNLKQNFHISPPIYTMPMVIWMVNDLPLSLMESINFRAIVFASTKQFTPVIRRKGIPSKCFTGKRKLRKLNTNVLIFILLSGFVISSLTLGIERIIFYLS